MVHLSKPEKCENPNCRRLVRELISTSFEGDSVKSYRLCSSCRIYARGHVMLRPAAVIGRARRYPNQYTKFQPDLSNIDKNGVWTPDYGDCQNPSCGKSVNELNMSKVRGSTFWLCALCKKYALEHRQLRPIEVTGCTYERESSAEHGEIRTCGNKNCRRVAETLISVQVKGKSSWLCVACNRYFYRHHKLRTADMEKKAQKLRELHEQVKEHEACQNPSCDVVGRVFPTIAEGKLLYLCHLCRGYAGSYGKLRSTKKMEVARDRKKRQAERNRMKGGASQGENVGRCCPQIGTPDNSSTPEVIVIDSDEDEVDIVKVESTPQLESFEPPNMRSADLTSAAKKITENWQKVFDQAKKSTSVRQNSPEVGYTQRQALPAFKYKREAPVGQQEFPPTVSQIEGGYGIITPETDSPSRSSGNSSGTTHPLYIPDLSPVPDMSDVLRFSHAVSDAPSGSRSDVLKRHGESVGDLSTPMCSKTIRSTLETPDIVGVVRPSGVRVYHHHSKVARRRSTLLRSIAALLMQHAEIEESEEQEEYCQLEDEERLLEHIHRKRRRRHTIYAPPTKRSKSPVKQEKADPAATPSGSEAPSTADRQEVEKVEAALKDRLGICDMS